MYHNDDNFWYQQPQSNVESYHGLEPIRNYEPSREPEKKRKKKGAGVKIAALALACALLGGAAGGGAVWYGLGRNGTVVRETTIQVAGQPPVADSVNGASGGVSKAAALTAPNTANGKTALTDAQIYESQVGAVVSINVSANSTSSPTTT